MSEEKKLQDMMERLPIGVRDELNRFFIEKGSDMSISGKSCYVKALLSLTRVNKQPLKKMTKKDLMQWTQYLDSNYKPRTRATYKSLVKRFFAWLYNCEEGEYPEPVKWIKVGAVRNNMLSDKLVEEEAIFRLIQVADNHRDKALIAVLYDSACRVSEVLSLKIKHVKFDRYGAIIYVNGKTGERPIRLINSVPYLQAWLNVHPAKDNPEALVFIRARGNSFNSPLTRDCAEGIFRTLCKKAGLERRIHPHMLRHSRLTKLASKLKEPELRRFAGWTSNSDMPATYVHLSARDIDEAVRRAEGVEEPEEVKPESSLLKPRKCPRCEVINPADFKFCGKCGMALDLRAVMEIEETKKELNELKKIGIESGAIDIESGFINFDKLFESPTIQKQIQAIEAKLEEKLLERIEQRLIKKLGG